MQEQKYTALSVYFAKQQFYLQSQGQQTVMDTTNSSKIILMSLIILGASIGNNDMIKHQVLITQGYDPMTAMAAQQERAHEIGKQWYLTLAFLMSADRACFGCVLEKLENKFTQGQDRYLKTVTDAYNLLMNWKEDTHHVIYLTGNDGVTFTTTGSAEVKEETDGQNQTQDASNRSLPLWTLLAGCAMPGSPVG